MQGVLATHSRSPLKMQRREPSIRLSFSLGDLWRPHLGTSGGLFWGLFPLLSSLFSPLSSLLPVRAARCPKGLVPLWRLHCGTSGGLWGSLCSLLSSLFVLLSSLSDLFPLVSLPLLSQILLRTCPLRSSHQATDVAPNSLDPLRLPPWPGGMREAIK